MKIEAMNRRWTMNRREFSKACAALGGSLWILRWPWASLLARSPSGPVQLINQPKGECETRAPIPFDLNPFNWLPDMFGANLEDPEAFERFLQSLQENPPEVFLARGFVGLVPFDWEIRGVIKGQPDPILGSGTQPAADPIIGHERLSPDQLKVRIALLKEHTHVLHSQGRVKQVMPYIDFGTQLIGRHNRPPEIPPSVWGFWEFYDHWEEYAKPTGEFDLGPKPPDPTTWLRKSYDPNVASAPSGCGQLPDELKGLSFVYCPTTVPSYRYAACPNTQDWMLWWKQVVQWAARVGYDGVFIDNPGLASCWNEECQVGYRKWLQENFSPEEIRRYFTTLSPASLLADSSIEAPWCQDEEVRAWAASQYWGHVTGEKLEYLRKEARKVNPDFKLFTNGSLNGEYFMSEQVLAGELDFHRQRQRKDVGYFPGIYPAPEPVLVTNSFGYKYKHSLRRPQRFGYHVPSISAPPDAGVPDGLFVHNPDSALLNLVEASAFGGGAGIDAAQLRSYYNVYGVTPDLLHELPNRPGSLDVVTKIREVDRRFWRFIQQHERLYEGYRTHADVGIVFRDEPFKETQQRIEGFIRLTDLAKDLAGRGVLWDVLTENRCDEDNFTRLGALIYQDVSQISEAEVQAVQNYLEQGELVIAAKVVGDEDEWFRMRLPNPQRVWPPVGLAPRCSDGVRAHPAPLQRPVGAGTLIYEPGPLTEDKVIAAMEAHLGRPVQLVGGVRGEELERLRLNAWIRHESGERVILHMVNYNVPLGIDKAGQVQLLDNVRVSVPLPPEMEVHSVVLHSPETEVPTEGPVQFSRTADGLVTFRIPHLRIYTVAVIE